MSAAILSIGTELLRGEIHNTNCTWLCERVTDLGMEVGECVVVGDDRVEIAAALSRLSKAHDVLISTGGLGPTTDDLTAQAVAECLGVDLELDGRSLERIEARMRAAGRTVASSNAKQADFPRGASVLDNDWGTAPGFCVDIGSCRAAFLPGVPQEMKPMFDRHLASLVQARVTRHAKQVRLRTFGAPESQVNDMLQGIAEQYGVTLGYRAHFPEIEVKTLVFAAQAAVAETKARAAADAVRERLGELVYGEGDKALPEVVGDLLRAKGWTLALAESCSGGLLSELITQHPASDYFLGAVVSYANAIKRELLGVEADVLETEGAVSEAVVRQMAEGARRRLGSNASIALSGVAGPSGGTADKPVGLVHIAVSTPRRTVATHAIFSGDRRRVQLRAAYAALDLLRHEMTTDPEDTSGAGS